MNEKWRFRRNLFLIGLAHALMVAALLYFNRDGKSGGSSETITWIDPTSFSSNPQPVEPVEPDPPAPTPPPEPTAPPEPTLAPVITPPSPPVEDALSLATPTPSPTVRPTPRPTLQPTPRPSVRPAPRPTLRPSPRPTKRPVPTTRAKPTLRPTKRPSATPLPTRISSEPTSPPSPTKQPTLSAEEQGRRDAALRALRSGDENVNTPSTNADSGNSPGPGQGTGAGDGRGAGSGPGTDPGIIDAYNQVIQNRCTAAWDQPRSQIEAGYKFTVTMRITIDKDGSLGSYSLARSSGNEIVDESVKAALASIRRFPAPPTGKSYTININFVLGDE